MNVDKALLTRAIEEALSCFQTCTACADACLREDMAAELTTCIRTNLGCATTCAATVEVLSRHTGYDTNITRAQLQACIATCKACGDCGACEQACQALLDSINETHRLAAVPAPGSGQRGLHEVMAPRPGAGSTAPCVRIGG